MSKCDKCDDYFQGYVEELPHPRLAETGTEGACALCGKNTKNDTPPYEEWPIHQPPYQKCPCRTVQDGKDA